MADHNVMHTDPIDIKKTRRNHPIAVMTSMPAGKVVPLVAIPMLREDSYSGQITVKVEMQETKEMIMNGVTLRVTAYVVPWLALKRFQGSRDQFDRSWNKQPKDLDASAPVVPFVQTAAFGAHGSNLVYKYLGLHGKSTDMVNTMYLETYNIIDNFRANNRSRKLAERTLGDTTLSKAFWQHTRFEHVVPDFNQAVIDGEVALNIVNSRLQVKGIGIQDGLTTAALTAYRDSSGQLMTARYGSSGGAGGVAIATRTTGVTGNTNYADVYAELNDNGVTVSLAKLDQAKKLQSFARLREQYEGFDDDWIVDMLMDGLEIPDQALKQPVLIGDQTALFSQAKRYATDSGNLAESAVSGGAQVTMNLRVPRLSTGGVIMVLAEALPVQLFERQRDPLLFVDDVVDFPAYLRDHLDPEKVDVVFNGEIDTDHDTPSAHFGYAPMNWKWTAFGPRVGGDFYRPTVDGLTDDLRQRIWANETENPALAEDFYRVGSDIQLKPFLDPDKDPFQVSVGGMGVLIGNTQFGPLLPEAKDDNYAKVAAKAPNQLIVKP